MNICFVKFGDLYNEKHVNQLYTDLVKLYPEANYWCYTDNRNKINSNIKIIDPILTLKKWWNKLALFSNVMPFKGNCLFFDLDMKINKKFEVAFDGLTVVNNYTKKYMFYRPHSYDVTINSSIITWIAGEQCDIWNKFLLNKDYYMRKYKGIDRFIVHEKFPYNRFKDGLVNIVQEYDKPNAPIYMYNGIEYEL